MERLGVGPITERDFFSRSISRVITGFLEVVLRRSGGLSKGSEVNVGGSDTTSGFGRD